MKLYRLDLRPLSPWRTPWQADTLSGLLCWACARRDGPDVLRNEILNPAHNGEPPFTVSDAFPAGYLPMPISVRLQPWPPEHRKQVKRCRWLMVDAFRKFQRGASLTLDDLTVNAPLKSVTQQRNTIGRSTNTTSMGGSLFSEQSVALADDAGCLAIYVRLADSYQSRFVSLMQELSQTGFGADASVGKGQFEIRSELTPVNEFDEISDPAGVVVLSTFQPGPNDPTDGFWDTFTKYGKLGPDFGLDNVFKRPFIMFRSGACLRTSRSIPCVGRVIPMQELVSNDVANLLAERHAEPCHLAFGLCVPVAGNLSQRS